MSAPNYQAADFLAALQALLPRGYVWPRDPDATLTNALSGLAPSYQRQTARANNLLVDAYPKTTVELLPEWESTLGLPDPCAGISPTIQARRAQVVARLTAIGGQSAAYMQSFAAALGYSVTVSNFAPFRMGQSSMWQQLGDQSWFFTFAINDYTNTITPFQMGQSACGEPLSYWGNSVLECEIKEIAPAHTVPQFIYSPNPAYLDVNFSLDSSLLS